MNRSQVIKELSRNAHAILDLEKRRAAETRVKERDKLSEKILELYDARKNLRGIQRRLRGYE